ncbi:lytic transglycosylase domain-containing protein [Xanthomonas euvesicatoria]|uniref:lytic transglycosylase domain-containing protein n=1 Tax=Xanthomonas euvesicatoria TaxID=456327 RepID=UPI001C482AFE|nr:transglycosylase SLT domain-containing protein [Xanthomonas campestris pv. heliotropii]
MLLEFMDLAQQCAPTVAPQTMAALVQVESGFNPYAIGVVDGRLARQPVNLEEAVATAQQLEAGGWNFSLGIAQVNRHNLPKYKLTYAQAFDACANLRAGSKILQDCYARASAKLASEKDPLHAAFSCYYSGNFSRGFRPDKAGQPSYVQKVLASAGVVPKAIPVVPAIGARTSPNARVPAAEPAQPGDATAAVPLTAAPAPSEPAEPADHASVLVDLDPPKRSALPQPPAAPVADDAVKLKEQQPSASPTPAADADDFSVF